MRFFALLYLSLAGAVALPAQTLTENWELTQFSDHPERLTFQARTRPGALEKTFVLVKHHDANIFNGEMVSFFLKTSKGATLLGEITLEKTEKGNLFISGVWWDEKGLKLSEQNRRRILHKVFTSIWEWSEADRTKLWPFLREIQ